MSMVVTLMLTIIAAMARNRVIGKNNTIPWQLQEDMRRFRHLTLGSVVIVGRKTFESMGVLRDRDTIVVTSQQNYISTLSGSYAHINANVVVAHSIQEAMYLASPRLDINIIGGAEIYHTMLDKCDMLKLTLINASIEGDALFPQIDPNKWYGISSVHHSADHKNEYDMDFVTMEKI